MPTLITNAISVTRLKWANRRADNRLPLKVHSSFST
jgi:hypothetical protein